MREELINKILMIMQSENIGTEAINEIHNELVILFNDYEVQERETAVAVRNEDINIRCLKKFLIAKSVAGRTDQTIDYYKKILSRILDDINKSVDEITTDDIRYYLALRQRRDCISTTTAKNEMRCLSSFFAFLTAEELVAKNPCLKIEPIKEEKKQKKAFTELEVEQIRAACNCARETAIVELLMSTGCRVTELCTILLSDITGDRLIVHGKGRKDRTVYLNAKAQMALQFYVGERKDKNPYLFPKGASVTEANFCGKKELWYQNPECVLPDEHVDKGSIEKTVRKIGRRAGVEKVHPHRFRRTCATFALRRGMPIEQVSKMLGHEKIETTQIYLDLSEEELHQAHKKYVI